MNTRFTPEQLDKLNNLLELNKGEVGSYVIEEIIHDLTGETTYKLSMKNTDGSLKVYKKTGDKEALYGYMLDNYDNMVSNSNKSQGYYDRQLTQKEQIEKEQIDNVLIKQRKHKIEYILDYNKGEVGAFVKKETYTVKDNQAQIRYQLYNIISLATKDEDIILKLIFETNTDEEMNDYIFDNQCKLTVESDEIKYQATKS